MIDKKFEDENLQDLLARYAVEKDQYIRDKTVHQCKYLVDSISRKFIGSGEPIEDIVQEGYIGLINCIDTYDISKGAKFTTYATHFIIGQIKHALRDKGKIIKEPAWLQELNHKMTRVIESLYQELGRYPTEYEIGNLMHLPEKTVSELITTRDIFRVTSLDGNVDDGYDSNDIDNIKSNDLTVFTLPLEDKIVMETAMAKLKLLEQKVIQEHYYTGRSQTEIAANLGISCNYVSHILRNGTQKLRRILVSEEIRDANISNRSVSQDYSDVNSTVLDTVTRVYNSEYLISRLDEEVNRAARNKGQVAFIILSLLNLQDINDKYGDSEFNSFLAYIAGLVKDNMRKCDIIGRLSDTQFGLLLPYTGDQAIVVCTRLGKLFEDSEIAVPDTAIRVKLIVDMAFSVYPTDATCTQQLISTASNSLDMVAD
ncbi:MAG: sigma-70 family RNA polymerase sigma factor [Armatimonadota bacterium]